MDLFTDFLKSIGTGLGESIGFEIGDLMKLFFIARFRKSKTEKKEDSQEKI